MQEIRAGGVGKRFQLCTGIAPPRAPPSPPSAPGAVSSHELRAPASSPNSPSAPEPHERVTRCAYSTAHTCQPASLPASQHLACACRLPSWRTPGPSWVHGPSARPPTRQPALRLWDCRQSIQASTVLYTAYRPPSTDAHTLSAIDDVPDGSRHAWERSTEANTDVIVVGSAESPLQRATSLPAICCRCPYGAQSMVLRMGDTARAHAAMFFFFQITLCRPEKVHAADCIILYSTILYCTVLSSSPMAACGAHGSHPRAS